MKIYLKEPFEYSHENMFFRKLARMLENKFQDDPLATLIGNPKIDRSSPDAVFMRKGQLTIIEFKNYGNGKLNFIEDSAWTIESNDGSIVEMDYADRGVNITNPYQQVNRYRKNIGRFLKDKFWDFSTAPDVNHITVVVLFYNPIQFDRGSLSPSIQSFFYICDSKSIVDTLSDLYSKKMILNQYDVSNILKVIDIDQTKTFTTTNENSIIENVESTSSYQKENDEKHLVSENLKSQTLTTIDVNHFKKLFALAKDLLEAEIKADSTNKDKLNITSIHRELMLDLEQLEKYDGKQGYGALGHIWGTNPHTGSIEDGISPDNIYTISPLNDKQKRAVSAGLSRRLTCITGPPGTGKTQVVLNLIANAIILGETVVVASKNNLAIDVVRSRLESALGIPFGLRLGQRQSGSEHQLNYLAKIEQRLMNQLDNDRSSDIESLKDKWLNESKKNNESIAVDLLKAVIENDMHHLDLKLLEAYARKLNGGITDAMFLLLHDEFKDVKSTYDGDLNLAFHKQHRLIFTTALTAYSGLSSKPESIDLIIIDEASQCDLVSMYPLLVRAKRVVVLGDPLQLKHVSQVKNEQDAEIAQKYGFPPMGYPKRSLYDAVYRRLKTLGDRSVIFLRDHYRCHQDIINFSNTHFYEPTFGVGLIPIPGKVPTKGGWFWVDVKGKISENTKTNLDEAQRIRTLYQEIRTRLGPDVHIGVIAPFNDQVTLIKKELEQELNIDQRLSIATINKFQGDERDVIILSVTLASGNKSTYLSSKINNDGDYLINVAVTRAKSELYVVGHREYLLSLGNNTILGSLARWQGSEVQLRQV